MKYILVWSNYRMRDMSAVRCELLGRHIECIGSYSQGTITCTKVAQIFFTNNLQKVCAEGRRYDEIFIMADEYPFELTYKTTGEPVHHDRPLTEVIANYIEELHVESIEYVRKQIEAIDRRWANHRYLKIKNVIFNDPATIVFWSDGTKTVVKCQDGDEFNPETGLAMAISKKALGNKGNYCNELKKWLPESEAEKDAFLYDIKIPDTRCLTKAVEALRNFEKEVGKQNKKSAVRKAYDILVEARDGDIDYSTLLHPIEEAIGYLGEALED